MNKLFEDFHKLDIYDYLNQSERKRLAHRGDNSPHSRLERLNYATDVINAILDDFDMPLTEVRQLLNSADPHVRHKAEQQMSDVVERLRQDRQARLDEDSPLASQPKTPVSENSPSVPLTSRQQSQETEFVSAKEDDLSLREGSLATSPPVAEDRSLEWDEEGMSLMAHSRPDSEIERETPQPTVNVRTRGYDVTISPAPEARERARSQPPTTRVPRGRRQQDVQDWISQISPEPQSKIKLQTPPKGVVKVEPEDSPPIRIDGRAGRNRKPPSRFDPHFEEQRHAALRDQAKLEQARLDQIKKEKIELSPPQMAQLEPGTGAIPKTRRSERLTRHSEIPKKEDTTLPREAGEESLDLVDEDW
jgi:hypothetical protein